MYLDYEAMCCTDSSDIKTLTQLQTYMPNDLFFPQTLTSFFKLPKDKKKKKILYKLNRCDQSLKHRRVLNKYNLTIIPSVELKKKFSLPISEAFHNRSQFHSTVLQCYMAILNFLSSIALLPYLDSI